MMFSEVEFENHFIRNSSSGDWYNYKTDHLHVKSKTSLNYYSKILEHEFNHFFIHSFTPYGFFLGELSLYQEQRTFGYILRHGFDLEDLPIYYPIFRFASTIGYDSKLIEQRFPKYGVASSLVHWFVINWSHAVFVERCFEGLYYPSVNKSLVKDFLPLFNRIEKELVNPLKTWPIEKEIDQSHRPNQYTPISLKDDKTNKTTCPKRSTLVRQNNFPIGAWHIFESLALLAEGPNKIKIIKMLMSDEGNRYLAIFREFSDKCEELNWDLSKRERWATLISICELSLFTPVGSWYHSIRKSHMDYLDIHPGYRVLKIINELEQFGIINGLDQIRQHQNLICEVFDWPEPSEFFQIARIMKPSKENGKRHKTAMNIKSMEDGVLFSDSDRIDDYFFKHPPILTTPEGTFFMRTGQSLSESVVKVFMSEVTWSLMTSSIPWQKNKSILSQDFSSLGYKNRNEFIDFMTQSIFSKFKMQNFKLFKNI